MCRALRPKFMDEVNRLGLKENEDYEFVDATEREDLAGEYGVRNIPTLVFLKDGDVIGRSCGVMAHNDIKKYYGND